MHDDEHHLVVLGGERLLRIEQLVELQILAVGERGAQVPVDLPRRKDRPLDRSYCYQGLASPKHPRWHTPPAIQQFAVETRDTRAMTARHSCQKRRE